jgi:pimeloyl-ACP methyl ester carboxylesterase
MHRVPRTRRTRRVAAKSALTVLLGAVAAIALVVTVQPPAAVARSAEPAVPVLRWTACGGGFECAQAAVPLDYDNPAGPTISLSLIMLPATDQRHRVGSLLTNPGGPATSSIDSIRGTPTDIYPPAMRARFDIVGFDPRGVAHSSPIRCFPSNEAKARFFADVPLFPITRRDEVAFIAKTAELGAICVRHNASIMQHMSTANVARDMDLLRQALGDAKLNFYGASYGSYLGNVYANLFPGKVRTLVMDSIVEPVNWATGRGDGFTLPVYNRERSDQGASATMRQFLSLCDRAGPRCAFSPGDPAKKWERLLAGARRAPITYAQIVAFTAEALSDPPGSWSALAEQLQHLYASSNPHTKVAARRSSAPQPTRTEYNNKDESFLAITCTDTNNPRDPFRWPAVAAERDRRFDPFGSFWAYLSEPCATWPARDRDRYTGPFTHRTSAPILIIGTRFDPASPYRNARAVAHELPRSRLLTLDGWGHVAFGKSRCIAHHLDRYLVAAELPPPETSCRPDQRPFGNISPARPHSVKSVVRFQAARDLFKNGVRPSGMLAR